jgi:hypothetical protein
MPGFVPVPVHLPAHDRGLLRETQGLNEFEIKVLRRIVGPSEDEVLWRILYNEALV